MTEKPIISEAQALSDRLRMEVIPAGFGVWSDELALPIIQAALDAAKAEGGRETRGRIAASLVMLDGINCDIAERIRRGELG